MTEPPAVLITDLTDVAPTVGEMAGATSIGPVRRENQDVLEAMAMSSSTAVLLVADGMGGLAGGAEAARAAADAALEVLTSQGAEPEGAAAAVHRANEAVDALRARIGGHPGTTLTLAVVRADGAAVLAHAGDSRAYLVQGGHAVSLTSDHSWVGEQVRTGALSPGAERHHPRRNVITMAVMGDPITPEVIRQQLVAGDILALCSDGFWEPLTEEQIAELMMTPGPLPAVAARAVEAALAAGATDNVTVLLLRLR